MAIEKELLKGIELLKEGKEEGFNILYSYTYNYVYGRAKVIMKNEDDALDLTQETFVQAYKGIQQLEDVNNIYAWLGSIIYRQGMRMFRKRKEVLVGEDAEGIFEDVEDDDSDYHPEASAEEKATADIVKSMIDELPELQKATIMAYYYDNMKIDEIAEVFECSSNTVKSRLNYAKKFLKTKVEEHEKQNRYKLHSLTPAVFMFAFRSLFSGEKYVMSAAVAHGVYDGVCADTGIAASEITVGKAGIDSAKGATTTAEKLGSSVTSSSSSAAIGGTVATETVVKAGMSLGMKILLGAVAVLSVGGITVGAMSLSGGTQVGAGNVTQTQENQSEVEETQEKETNVDNDSQEIETESEIPLPEDREWIDEVYNDLLAANKEKLIELLTREDLEETIAPYIKKNWAMWDYEEAYALITTDGKTVGIILYENESYIFYSDNDGFEALHQGDFMFSYNKQDSSYSLLDGDTLYFSDGRTFTLSPEEIVMVWHM